MVDFLIIRCKCDDPTELSHPIGNGMKTYLENKGYSVTDLSDSAANPTNVENWLNHSNMNTTKAVIALDHGTQNALLGEDAADNLIPVIHLGNAQNLTRELHVYTFACLTNVNNGVGQTAVQNGCYSWLGYTNEVFAIESESFKNCIWSYMIEMAEGKTIEECEAKLKQECQNRLDESFAYYILLEEMLLRKSEDNMTIQSHNRNPTPVTEPDQPTNCLFALAAIGSSFAINVQFLRQVRDETLKSNCVWASIINAIERIYYIFSPSIVNKMQLNEKFKQSMRKFIVQPVVLLLTNIFKNLENKSSILERN